MISPANPPGLTKGGINAKQSGLGVTVASIVTSFAQGAVQQDGINSHVMLSGKGFFVVQQTGCPPQYTRDGSFSLDADGNLVNSEGLYVQGWFAQPNGQINTGVLPTDLSIPLGQQALAQATTEVDYGGTLDASTPVAPSPDSTRTTAVEIFDALGTPHVMHMDFQKVAPNTWNYTMSFPGDPAVASVTPNQAVNQVVYNGVGQPVSGTTPNFTITFTSGAQTPQTINLDLTQTNQLDITDTGTPPSPTHTIDAIAQNGFTQGTLDTFNIAQDGTIVGQYSNGQFRPLAQLAVANFINPGGLVRTSSNNYIESVNSGLTELGPAESCGATILAGALEQSNVDVTQEFTKMIVSQRAFQANSRVVSTSDELLNESLNILRR
ncbi:MAG: flagellar hook protein FlgE [Armatimonadetes bacterium]|nr:flagellar hook protein FlgE [Armatimonadota bacterium]